MASGTPSELATSEMPVSEVGDGEGGCSLNSESLYPSLINISFMSRLGVRKYYVYHFFSSTLFKHLRVDINTV